MFLRGVFVVGLLALLLELLAVTRCDTYKEWRFKIVGHYYGRY
jgi:hypothetical protein